MKNDKIQTKKAIKYKIDKKTGLPKQPPFRVAGNICRLFAKAFHHTPGYTVLSIFEAVVNGLMKTASTYFTYLLLNNVSADDFTLEGALHLIAVLSLIWCGYAVFTNFTNQLLDKIGSEKLLLKVHEELFKKAQTMDVANFDNPVFFNDYVWAMNQGGHKVLDGMEDACRLLRDLVAAGALSALAISIDPMFGIVILVVTVWQLVVQTMCDKKWYVTDQKTNPVWRRQNYSYRVFSQPEYAKEIRQGSFARLFAKSAEKAQWESYDLGMPTYWFNEFMWSSSLLLATAGRLFVVITMLRRLTAGTVLLGSFVAATMVVWNVMNQFSNVIWWCTKFVNTSRYAEKYFTFLKQDNHLVSGGEDVPAFESLTLSDVSFTYDFSDQPVYEFKREEDKKDNPAPYMALKHVSMELHRGEKIAIVGYNGAGKTTLIKLLMHLYDPTEGQILLNGQDIRSYDLQQYRDKIGVVFQDFAIFAATVAENVMNGAYDPEKDEATVKNALHATGFDEKLAALKYGVDTVLTREFDDEGTNLSGGEAQRVKLAAELCKRSTGKTFYILKDESLRAHLVQQEESVIPKLTTVIVKAKVLSGNRPTLTRYTCRHEIMLWQFLQFGNVTKVVIFALLEVSAVCFNGIGCNLTKANALSAHTL